MDYVQHTTEQEEAMLKAVGVASVEEFYASLDARFRLKQPIELEGLEKGLSELEIQRALAQYAGANQPAGEGVCFAGGGVYDHFIPTVVDQLAHQGEFVTAYTPYQAEASQGSLQAFFEFQTQVCRLTGLDVANASLYEGATAVAEAAMMALGVTGRRRVMIAQSVHPHYRRVLQTYLSDLPAQLVEVPVSDGKLDPAVLAEHFHPDTACVIIQSPNVFGVIEDWAGLFELVRSKGDGKAPLCVAVFNPIACGLLKRPGECGADIAVAEGQPLGIPMQFGGPFLGLFAVRQSLMRRLPGRVVGQTVDAEGQRAFCLTLQTREQHIRRDKATSNICTNQGLLAVRATIYMSAMGAQGLREAATHCYHKAHQVAHRVDGIPGYSLAYDAEFFHEVVINCPVPAREIIDRGKARGIWPGLDCSQLGIGGANQLLISATEKRTAGDINALAFLLREFQTDRDQV